MFYCVLCDVYELLVLVILVKMISCMSGCLFIVCEWGLGGGL